MTEIVERIPDGGMSIALDNGASVRLAWSARTDTGLHRQANEDSVLAKPPLFAVADGMGGHSAGDFASAAVVTRFAEVAHDPQLGIDELLGALRSAVTDMGERADLTDLSTGTTVTGAALVEKAGVPYWLVFNIGDSRVYLLSSGVLDQLTIDHSIVQELIDAGQITPEQAETHPHSNVITRAVGFHEEPIPDFRLIPVEKGMRLLICSDGLTKELTSYGIRHYLLSSHTPAEAVEKLVDAALGNGGRDNVTAVVVEVLNVSSGVDKK